MNGLQFMAIYTVTYVTLMIAMHKLVAHLKAKQAKREAELERAARASRTFYKENKMKKIPAKYTLTEDDIKEAIKEWLFNNHDIEDNGITVTFHVETKQEQPDTPYRGGMSDWVDKTVITATAEEND